MCVCATYVLCGLSWVHFVYANDLVFCSFKNVVTHQTQEQRLQSHVHVYSYHDVLPNKGDS